MTLPAQITDWTLFSALPETSDKPYQTQTRNRLAAMAVIHAHEGKWKGVLEAEAQFAEYPGFKAKTLWALYDRLRRGTPVYEAWDWRILVDKNAGREWQHRSNNSLPVAFIQYVSSKWAMNQRDKFGSVYAAILNQWRRWRLGDEQARLPGYEACPAPSVQTDIPSGWGESNLRWLCKPATYSRKMIQIGTKAAAQFGPMLLRTRVGLEVGQYIICDDYWSDFMVLPPGARQACRLLQFDMLDLFSACDVTRGFKPAIEDEAGIQRRLQERDMVFLTAHLFTDIGYRRNGTTLICEAGTATIREREQRLLHDLSRGKIQVHIGACRGESKLAGFFDGASGGNPRFKAPLEAFWNLLHNRSADMLDFPGQTGSNSRLNKPEELVGRERHTVALLRAAAGLPADSLAMDFLSSMEAIFAVNRLIDGINKRRDHDLEGWREANLYVQEWRASTEWDFEPVALLEKQLAGKSESERIVRLEYLNSNPNLKRTRALSPHEVFESGRSNLVKLPAAVTAILLNDLEGSEVTVRGTRLSCMVPELNPDEPQHYEAFRMDEMGAAEPLQHDSKWLVRVNPLSPAQAYLYDASNGFKGCCRNITRVRWDDVEGMKRAWGRNKHVEAALVREAQRLAAPLLEAEAAKRAHNAGVFARARSRAPASAAEIEAGEAAADQIFDSRPAEPVRELDENGGQGGDDLLAAITEPKKGA